MVEPAPSRPGFFACYLLGSQNPRYKGRTYIGFTVNPRRRIRQHNGEITSGAWRTKKMRPWEMVLCLYGFPSQVHALQFEWAWQHPKKSLAVREAASSLKSLQGIGGKMKLLYTMLNLPEWRSLDLKINFLSSKNISFTKGCPTVPRLQVKIGPLEDLPCYGCSNFESSASSEDELEITEEDDYSSGGDILVPSKKLSTMQQEEDFQQSGKLCDDIRYDDFGSLKPADIHKASRELFGNSEETLAEECLDSSSMRARSKETFIPDSKERRRSKKAKSGEIKENDLQQEKNAIKNQSGQPMAADKRVPFCKELCPEHSLVLEKCKDSSPQIQTAGEIESVKVDITSTDYQDTHIHLSEPFLQGVSTPREKNCVYRNISFKETNENYFEFSPLWSPSPFRRDSGSSKSSSYTELMRGDNLSTKLFKDVSLCSPWPQPFPSCNPTGNSATLQRLPCSTSGSCSFISIAATPEMGREIIDLTNSPAF